MTLTRYWRFDACRHVERRGLRLGPLRPGCLHLIGLLPPGNRYRPVAPNLLTAPRPSRVPETRLAVYAGPYFALLRPSQLLEIILSHVDAGKLTALTADAFAFARAILKSVLLLRPFLP